MGIFMLPRVEKKAVVFCACAPNRNSVSFYRCNDTTHDDNQGDHIITCDYYTVVYGYNSFNLHATFLCCYTAYLLYNSW